uniref:Uncharacterized protein n=1 Tax=Megaselia scalaris TaxID=36166 RepID=T1GE61_MEGSC
MFGTMESIVRLSLQCSPSIKLLPEHTEKVQCGICFNMERRCSTMTSNYSELIGFPKHSTFLLSTIKRVMKALRADGEQPNALCNN